MSVQYPGSPAALLGVIHHHRLDTSFNFTPEIYSRIGRFCLVLCLCCVRLMIQINEVSGVIFFPYSSTRNSWLLDLCTGTENQLMDFRTTVIDSSRHVLTGSIVRISLLRHQLVTYGTRQWAILE
jgi:hypothetical protein